MRQIQSEARATTNERKIGDTKREMNTTEHNEGNEKETRKVGTRV